MVQVKMILLKAIVFDLAKLFVDMVEHKKVKFDAVGI